MSDEYIRREAVLDEAKKVPLRERDYRTYDNVVRSIPAADVVEVRHAKWHVTDAYPHNVYCSQCYKIFAQEHWEIWQDGSLPRDYCPSCGAQMDGGPEDG